jgi:hypothetical protein
LRLGFRVSDPRFECPEAESSSLFIVPPVSRAAPQAKGIPALVALLQSPSAAEAEAAAGALGLLAESDPLKKAMLDKGRCLVMMFALLLPLRQDWGCRLM